MRNATVSAALACMALLPPTSGATEAPRLIVDGVVLECRARIGEADSTWSVKLDSSQTIASVDHQEVAAEYSPSHARLRLVHNNRTLVIGRKSGRLLVTDEQGKGIGFGWCQPAQMASIRNRRFG